MQWEERTSRIWECEETQRRAFSGSPIIARVALSETTPAYATLTVLLLVSGEEPDSDDSIWIVPPLRFATIEEAKARAARIFMALTEPGAL